jgi:hypothetical protein
MKVETGSKQQDGTSFSCRHPSLLYIHTQVCCVGCRRGQSGEGTGGQNTGKLVCGNWALGAPGHN